VIHLSEQDILIEKFFLALRTSHGILDIAPYTPLLVPNYESLLQSFAESGLVVWDGTHVQLTDAGMEVSNSIITELLSEI
jgi:coproporphyrinogen III oxidase-like Fe-S oxidoreductase